MSKSVFVLLSVSVLYFFFIDCFQILSIVQFTIQSQEISQKENMYSRILFLCLLYHNNNGQIIFPDNQLYFSNDNPLSVDSQKKFALRDDSNSLNTYANNRDDNYETNHISAALNNFALNINRIILNKKNTPFMDNIVISPLSIVGALSLITLGSVGKTYEELANALGFFNNIEKSGEVHRNFGSLIQSIKDKNIKSDNRDLTYASALFVQNNFPIRKEYKDMIEEVYGSQVTTVDFLNNPIIAMNIINKWVSDKTNGRIQNIISDIPSIETRLIIASALHFKAEWEKHFFEELTRKMPFTLNEVAPGYQLTVDMMANEGNFSFYKSIENDCMILGLPYKGGDTTLYAIKPIDSSRKNLKTLLNEMNGEKLLSLIKNARKQSTIVLFPKMKLSANYQLKSVLEDMGIKSVFSGTEANLGLLTASPRYSPQIEDQNEERLIFSRFGETENKNNCNDIFQSNNPINPNCTATEIINGERVQVVYKKIGNQIGRRIVKNDRRRRRQTLSRIESPLVVEEVIHKVDMDITETGTEAAAATIAFITRSGNRPVFRADEPFFLTIIDEETKFPLFTSIVYNPQN